MIDRTWVPGAHPEGARKEESLAHSALGGPWPNSFLYSGLISSNCPIGTFLSGLDTRSAIWQEHKLKPKRTITGTLASEVKASQQCDSGPDVASLRSSQNPERNHLPARSQKNTAQMLARIPRQAMGSILLLWQSLELCLWMEPVGSLLRWLERKEGVPRANPSTPGRLASERWLPHCLAGQPWA